MTLLDVRKKNGVRAPGAAPTSQRAIWRRVGVGLLGYLALIVFAWAAIAPFLWALSSSLKTDGETFLIPPTLIPKDFQWGNYVEVFSEINLAQLFLNTTIYSASVTLGQVFFCSLAGYAFARLKFPGRNAVFLAYLATLMVPVMVVIVPQFMLMKWFGWVNTPWAMIVPGLFGNAFGTYLMRQFFITLPKELEEAAIIDGCTQWQVYWRVLLPLTKPALVTLGVLTWVTVWNDFMWPLVMIQDDSISTLTLGLVHMQGNYNQGHWPLLMAASVLMVAPLVIAYLFAQRVFVQGIAMTGIGGK